MEKITLFIFLFALPFLGISQTDPASPWDFNDSEDGWTGTSGSMSTEKQPTFYELTTGGGNNPQLQFSGDILTTDGAYLAITLKNSSATGPTFLRAMFPKDGGYHYPAIAISNSDTEYKTYYLFLTQSELQITDWTGTITDFRIQFKTDNDTSGGTTYSGSGDIIELDKMELLTEIPAKNSYQFDNDTFLEGWTNDGGAALSVSNGQMEFTPTDNVASKIEQSWHPIASTSNAYVHIRYKNLSSLNDEIQFSWRKGSADGGAVYYAFIIKTGMSLTDEFTDVVLDLNDLKGADWSDQDAYLFTMNYREAVSNKPDDADKLIIDRIEFTNSPVEERLNYTFDNTLFSEGFSAYGGGVVSQPVSGELELDVSAKSYPRIAQDSLFYVDADATKIVSIAFRNPTDANELRISVPKDNTASPSYKHYDNVITANLATSQTIVVDLTNTFWTGNVQGIEFQFRHNTGSVQSYSGTIYIEDIMFGARGWTGAVDTDWETATNWQGDIAPGLTPANDVVILGNSANYPTITGAQTLLVNSGIEVTIAPNAMLTNNGTITNSAGTVTFESDATGSAYIGESSGTFTGDFVVERYIPARRAFRMLSTPVTTDDFISDNWQQSTHITGSVGGSNGFDDSETGNSSMYTMDNTDASWDAIANTDATILSAGTPYRIMIRGDKTIDLTDNAAPATATTLIATGTLAEEGDDQDALTLNENSEGFSFIGNPFQAPVDMDYILSNNNDDVSPTYYWVWDPNLGDRGAYTTVTVAGGAATAGSDANQYLQAGQAAFVQTVSSPTTGVSLIFAQAAKHTDDAETAVFKTSGKSSKASKLSLNLYESSALAENKSASDGLLVVFDDAYTNAVNTFDAAKFSNLDENFSTSNEGNLLSIEQRALPTVSDEISLAITKYRNTAYTIVVEASAMTGETGYLYDAYADAFTEIPQDGTVEYSYTVDADDDDSIASDRFSVRFSKVLSVSDVAIQQILVYPNPVSNGVLYIQVPQNTDDLEVTIYNTMGAQLYSEDGFEAGSKAEINTTFASQKGMYFVRLTSKGNSTIKKIIIK